MKLQSLIKPYTVKKTAIKKKKINKKITKTKTQKCRVVNKRGNISLGHLCGVCRMGLLNCTPCDLL